MIKCPNCGAELKFDASEQVIECEYCKSKFNPDKLNARVSHAEESNTYEGKSYTCSQCGATLMTFDETAITFCSYCGSQAMIESKMIKQNNPDYIIPFSITKEECIKSYKKIISKSIFAPNYMKSDIVVNKFRGIYMPYCIYKLSHHGVVTNCGSKYNHRSGDYIYYDDYTIKAEVNADYDGISYDLISIFYDKFSYAIPHNFKEAKPFNPNYLSGFYADTVDVNSDIYMSDAKKVVNIDAAMHLRKKREFLKYGCSKPKVNLEVNDKKNAMYPVYFLSIRNKKNDSINYAIVNGQTGEAVADIPIDFKKYILISLLISLPIFLLINNLLVIVPKAVCIFSVFISVISLMISLYQLDSINKRKNHLDDVGYGSKLSKKNTEKISKIKYLYKTLLASVIGILALIMDFVNDICYYGASIIIFILIILSFYDLVREHNVLVSSKLPQLDKRGGDEDV